MQFNVKITLNRVISKDRHGEAEEAKSFPIKCALMSKYKEPNENLGGKSDITKMVIIIPHKKTEPYETIASSTLEQNFTHDSMTFEIEKINVIPSFSGKSKFYEITLKEQVSA